MHDARVSQSEQCWYILATASLEKFPELQTRIGTTEPRYGQSMTTLKPPLLMKKGDDWQSILERQIEAVLKLKLNSSS